MNADRCEPDFLTIRVFLLARVGRGLFQFGAQQNSRAFAAASNRIRPRVVFTYFPPRWWKLTQQQRCICYRFLDVPRFGFFAGFVFCLAADLDRCRVGGGTPPWVCSASGFP